jgi:hypothetical protein
MQNVSELKGTFDRLPVSTGNYSLYERLLALDQSVFKPLMEEILAGRLDIEDTRPLFNVNIRQIVGAETGISTNKIIQTSDDLRRNLVNRVFSPNEVIKEITLPRIDIMDLKMQIAEQYTAKTGQTLTDAQMQVILVAVDATRDITATSGGNKDEQQIYVNAMSAKPLTEF